MTPARAFRRLSFRLDAGSEELLAAELWALGTLGLESETASDGSITTVAYFPDAADAERLAAGFAGWRRRGVEVIGCDELPDRDWLAEYRRRARPFALGEGFWADPGDPGERPAPFDRVLLRLPARQAFGTGSHATTQLVVEALERRPPRGRSFLDVGAGTGVLSLVALELGATPVVAVELDPVAVIQAVEIARLNEARPTLVCGGLEALGDVRFERIAVNMTLGSLRPVLSGVFRLLAPGGEVVVSGALEEQRGELMERLRAVGLAPRAPRRREEWIAVRALREAP